MKETLEMTREQAEAVMRATELLARLHIGQFNEITWEFMDRLIKDGHTFDDYRRDRADELLDHLARTLFGVNKYGRPDVGEKDIMHHRCWTVYATLRHALAWHDHPEGGITVNFDKPLAYGEPMPHAEVRDE